MGEKAYGEGTGSTCYKGVVGDRWQDVVIGAHEFVFKVGIIMPAGFLPKIL